MNFTTPSKLLSNWIFWLPVTGKSFSEALILASTIPKYDKRLFIELQVQYLLENCKLRTYCIHELFWMSKQKPICVHIVDNIFWACNFHPCTELVMNNLLSYCGLLFNLSNKREVRLTDIEKKIPPPRLLILRSFPSLLVYFQNIPASTFIPTSTFIHFAFLHPLHVYSNLHGY